MPHFALLSKLKVNIIQYDPAWPGMFEDFKKEIQTACENKIHSIEHIGSTAVPGLGAKPIIDILLGVSSPENLDHIIPDMLDAGYVYISDFEHIMPYRRYFKKEGVHVHSVVVDSEFWKRHLAFRNYLRLNDDARVAYYNLKNELAQKEWNESNDYAYAKTEFVKNVEKTALEYFAGQDNNKE